jgi:hypothetical protein
MNKKKLWPPYLWRYLVQQSFQKTHPDAPVMVANAVLILNSWIKETDRGVEWGSGRSTAWLAARCSHFLTVEYDEHWYAKNKVVLENRGLARKVDYRFVAAVGDQMDEPRDHPYAGVADELENASLDFAIRAFGLNQTEDGIDVRLLALENRQTYRASGESVLGLQAVYT